MKSKRVLALWSSIEEPISCLTNRCAQPLHHRGKLISTHHLNYLSNARSGARTHGHKLKRLALYRLSYPGKLVDRSNDPCRIKVEPAIFCVSSRRPRPTRPTDHVTSNVEFRTSFYSYAVSFHVIRYRSDAVQLQPRSMRVSRRHTSNAPNQKAKSRM